MLRISGLQVSQHEPRPTPRIGVMSGATIIAPITVAVESDTTPTPSR